MFLWGYVDRCPSLLYDVYDLFDLLMIYFDHHLSLKPSIGKRRKQSCTPNRPVIRSFERGCGAGEYSWKGDTKMGEGDVAMENVLVRKGGGGMSPVRKITSASRMTSRVNDHRARLVADPHRSAGAVCLQAWSAAAMRSPLHAILIMHTYHILRVAILFLHNLPFSI